MLLGCLYTELFFQQSLPQSLCDILLGNVKWIFSVLNFSVSSSFKKTDRPPQKYGSISHLCKQLITTIDYDPYLYLLLGSDL